MTGRTYPSGRWPIAPADLAIAALFAVAAALLAWHLTGMSSQIVKLMDIKADDVWFEGDEKRVFDNMTQRLSPNYRTSVHPLFSLFTETFTYSFRWLFKADLLTSVRALIALGAALWLATLFGVLRLLDCQRADAALFTALAGVSAGAIFWTAIPETYLFSSVTVLIVLGVAALSERRPIPIAAEVVTAAVGLSSLVTNFMFAVISLATRYRLRNAIQIACNGFVLVVLLWGIQKYLIPSAVFFIGTREPIPWPDFGTAPGVFFLHSMVMPDVQQIANDQPWLWPKFSTQHATTWHLSKWGLVALWSWLPLLAAGIWATVTLPFVRRFRTILLTALAAQFALHLVFGNETFLYVMNWIPLLVIIAALATQTRLCWLVRALALIFIIAAAQHNYLALRHTLATLDSLVS